MRSTINPYLSALRPPWDAGRRKADPQAEAQRIREVAQEFEALMLEQMMREMRDAVPKATLLGRESGQELFNEMLDGEYVRLMTERGGIGLTDVITRALDKQGHR